VSPLFAKKTKRSPARLILSRTDSIGDVMLSLPMAFAIKRKFPNCELIFLGRTYTGPVIELCSAVDKFENYDQWEKRSADDRITYLKSLQADVFVHVFPKKEIAKLAKQAGIPMRIGTSHRAYHLLTASHRPSFTRRDSDLHEAQLNMELLLPIAVDEVPTLAEMGIEYMFPKETIQVQSEEHKALLSTGKINVVLHPKSKGSAVEWGLENFSALIHLLPPERCAVFITGTAAEGEMVIGKLPFELPHVHNMTGRMSLDELIQFIGGADTLVAASTGPLHIAAACGIQAIGLYADRRPIHPGRWAPIGPKAMAITYDGAIAKGEEDASIMKIEPSRIAGLILGKG
jgi:heptosyltransferase-3